MDFSKITLLAIFALTPALASAASPNGGAPVSSCSTELECRYTQQQYPEESRIEGCTGGEISYCAFIFKDLGIAPSNVSRVEIRDTLWLEIYIELKSGQVVRGDYDTFKTNRYPYLARKTL